MSACWIHIVSIVLATSRPLIAVYMTCVAWVVPAVQSPVELFCVTASILSVVLSDQVDSGH